MSGDVARNNADAIRPVYWEAMSEQPFRTTTRSIPPKPERQRQHSPYPWLAFGVLVLAALYVIAHLDPQTTTMTVAAPQEIDSRVADALATGNAIARTALVTPTATATRTPTPQPPPSTAVPGPLDVYGACDDLQPSESICVPLRPAIMPTPFATCAPAGETVYEKPCRWKATGEPDVGD